MDIKQKRKIYSLIHNTFSVFILISIACIIYFCIDKIISNTNSLMWLNIVLLILCFIIFTLTVKDIILTKNMKNKYSLMISIYLLFVVVFVGYIILFLYCYISKFDIQNYISYLIPLLLVLFCIISLIINLFIGFSLSKFIKNISVTLDSSSDTPSFNDEVLLKKKLDELNRKLSIKKIQQKIDEVEKQLDE